MIGHFALSSRNQANDADIFTHRLRNLIELVHETGEQLFTQYIDFQEQKKSDNQKTMNGLVEWCEKQKKRQQPVLPKLGGDVQPKSAQPVKTEDQDKVSGEALDKMLYADINPSLNLQEVLNAHKEASLLKDKLQSENANNGAKPDVEMQANAAATAAKEVPLAPINPLQPAQLLAGQPAVGLPGQTDFAALQRAAFE